MYTFESIGSGLALNSNDEISSFEGYSEAESHYIPSVDRVVISTSYSDTSLVVVDVSGASITDEIIKTGSDEIDGLNPVKQTIVNSENNTIYTLSTIDSIDNSRNGDNALVVFEYSNSNELSRLQEIKFLSSNETSEPIYVSSMALSPEGKSLYVIGSTAVRGEPRMMAYDVNSDTGLLTKIQLSVQDFIAPTDAREIFSSSISPDGSFLYTASKNSDGQPFVTCFSRNIQTGLLEELSSYYLNATYSGVHWSRQKPFMRFSKDGGDLYYFDKAFSLIAQFKRDIVTGELVAGEFLQDGDSDADGQLIEGLIEIADAAISSSGDYIYAVSDEIYARYNPFTGFYTNRVGIQVFSVDQGTGRLVNTQIIKSGGTDASDKIFDSNFLKGGYRSLILSDDGKYLYAILGRPRITSESIFGNAHGIDVFEINGSSGGLSFIQRLDDSYYGRGVSSLSSVKGTGYILVSNERTDEIGLLEEK